MTTIDQIFGYYDKFIAQFPVGIQAIISLALLALLIWQIFMVIKSGHWIFIAALVILLPGTWPAVKTVFHFIVIILKLLLIRAQLLIN